LAIDAVSAATVEKLMVALSEYRPVAGTVKFPVVAFSAAFP
jgi:hypothetical protein